MIINNTHSLNKKRQNFGSIATATTQTLRFLNTSPAIGATCVDLFSMSLPRTIVDISRNPDAGLETGIREGSGTVNHALIGAYGLLAASLVSGSVNKKFGVNTNKVFANFENIDTLGSIWHNIVKENKDASPLSMRKIFLEEVLNSSKGNAQNAKGELVRVSFDKKAVRSAVSEISNYMDKNPKSYNLPKKLHNYVKSLLSYSTAAESDYLVKTAKYSSNTDLDTLLKSTYSLGKIFSEPKALKEFKNSTDIVSNTFLKSLKNTKLKSSLLGVAIGMLVGSLVQPINVWLTKKRTGKEGFVGVEGNKQDLSFGFKALKTSTALGFLAFAYSTIVDNVFKTPLKKQGSKLLNKLQFNGIVPSLPQFKAVYAFTVASRMLAARDKNELRESATKDFLGFANWLILGDFVQKLVATFSNKNLTTYDESKHGKGLLNKIFNSNVRVKTHDEILFEELKKTKQNFSALTSVDGKMLSPKRLISKFSDSLPNLKSRIRSKNIAQLSGYLYSAVVLGVLIPKLNIAITNYIEGRKNKNKVVNNQFLNNYSNIKHNSFSNFS